MSRVPGVADLRAETRNWFGRGTIPSIAAEYRRHLAHQIPLLADWHNAYAAEWDAIEQTQPGKVRLAHIRQRDYALECLAHHTPGSTGARYWQGEAAKWDRAIGEEF